MNQPENILPVAADVPAALSPDIDAKLRAAWLKERRLVHIRGICHLLAWLIALAVVDFFADWLLQLPGWGRVTLLLINIAVMIWAGWNYWWRFLRHYDPLRVALQVEKQHGELRSLLVSYVQLRADRGGFAGNAPSGAAPASPQLIAAMRRQAVAFTAPIDFRQIISYGELRRIVIVSGALVALCVAMSVNWSGYARVLLVRMLDPNSDARYPTRTQIEPLEQSEIVIRQGDSVPLKFIARGLVPNEGTLYLTPDGGDAQKIEVSKSGAGCSVSTLDLFVSFF